MKNPARFSKAQFAAVYTIVVLFLLGAMGMSTDMAVLYVEWGRLQKAADASALAGAGYLTGDPKSTNVQNVIDHATEYLQRNGIAQAEIVEITPAADARSVKVVVMRNVPYYFFKLIGLDRAKAAAMAVAGVYPTQAACGVLPFGVQCLTADYNAASVETKATCGTEYNLYTPVDLKNTQVPQPGNWGPLALGGSGASNFRTRVAEGYPQMLSAEDTVSSETGNVVGPTRQGFADRMNGQPYKAAPTSAEQQASMGISSEDPQVMLVPLVDWSSAPKGGKTTLTILDFMTVYVTGVGGNDATISVVPIEPVAGCGKVVTDPGKQTGHAPLKAVLCPDSGCTTISWWPS